MSRSNSKSYRRQRQLRRAVFAAAASAALAGWTAALADEKVPPEEPRGVLEVIVTGFESDAGRLAIALFGRAADYETQSNAVRRAWLDIEGPEAVWRIGDLPEGEYAVIAYQDENGNEEIDMRIFGMPKEPVGVSNNARGLFGPPRFDAAKFRLVPPLTRHEFELR